MEYQLTRPFTKQEKRYLEIAKIKLEDLRRRGLYGEFQIKSQSYTNRVKEENPNWKDVLMYHLAVCSTLREPVSNFDFPDPENSALAFIVMTHNDLIESQTSQG